MFDDEITKAATAVLDACRAARLTVATVESCTGGLIAGALTAIAGSSDVVNGGLVTYANAAKTALAGVPSPLIEVHGAVSEPVARAMAQGGRVRLDAGLCVAVTGVAGPGGGSLEKPVGLVHLACAGRDALVHREQRYGALSRDEIRRLTVLTALDMLLAAAVEAR